MSTEHGYNSPGTVVKGRWICVQSNMISGMAFHQSKWSTCSESMLTINHLPYGPV